MSEEAAQRCTTCERPAPAHMGDKCLICAEVEARIGIYVQSYRGRQNLLAELAEYDGWGWWDVGTNMAAKTDRLDTSCIVDNQPKVVKQARVIVEGDNLDNESVILQVGNMIVGEVRVADLPGYVFKPQVVLPPNTFIKFSIFCKKPVSGCTFRTQLLVRDITPAELTNLLSVAGAR